MYWLSFVSAEDKFQGVVIVDANIPEQAISRARKWKLAPRNCQVLAVKVPEQHEAQARPYRHRLLGHDEITRVFGESGTPEEIKKAIDNGHGHIICEHCND